MKPLNQRYKGTKDCEEVTNYEIVNKINKHILTEEEKKTLVQGLTDGTNCIQDASFHM